MESGVRSGAWKLVEHINLEFCGRQWVRGPVSDLQNLMTGGTLWLCMYAFARSHLDWVSTIKVVRFKKGPIASIKMDRVGLLSEFQKICVNWHRTW